MAEGVRGELRDSCRVQAGDFLAVLEEGAAAAEAPAKEEKSAKADAGSKPATSSAASSAGNEDQSPAVRKLLSELGLSASQISGSGKGGRLTVEDVKAYADKPKPAAAKAEPEEAVEADRPGWRRIVLWLALYFVAFNILEATLPSLISKIAPADAKGTAIGVYNTAQSFGLFAGAVAGGWLYSHHGALGVFAFTSVLMLAWLLLSLTMTPPKAVKSQMFHIGEQWQGDADTLSRQLASQRGVSEVVVLLGERVAYLKVSQQDWDEAAVKQLIQATY